MQQQSHSVPENSAATYYYGDNHQLFPHINYAWNFGRKHCDLVAKSNIGAGQLSLKLEV